MIKKTDFSFAMGYISYLSSKLLKNKELEKLKNSKTFEEFFINLKNEGYSIKNCETEEKFEEELDKKYIKTIKELKEICPKTKYFEYIFCKNNFLNFKIYLKAKFSNKNIENKNNLLTTISKEKIKNCIENKNFEDIKSPFKEAFEESFNIIAKIEDKQQVDILIDKKMYECLLIFAEKNEFLTKRTKLEITIKNINFCIRFIENKFNIKDLNLYLLDNGLIEKEKYFNFQNKDKEKIYSLFKEITTLKKLNMFSLEEIEEKILNDFDEKYIFDVFCFTPIFIYIKNLEKEIKILKKILLKINFQEER